MKTKMFIIPILILALVTVIVAPPVHAELLTLSIILAAAFDTSIFVNETLRPNLTTKRLQNITRPPQFSKQILIIQILNRLPNKQANC